MKSKMQRDVNWKEILYLACLCTYIIISTLVGEGSILTYIPLVKWEHYIAFINMIKALLVLKMIFDIAEEPRMCRKKRKGKKNHGMFVWKPSCQFYNIGELKCSRHCTAW